MKKILFFLVLIALTVSLVFMGIGCKEEATTTEEAAEETEVTEETTEITDEPITLYMWVNSSTTGDKWIKWVNMYMESHPNVTIEMTPIGYDELGDISESALASQAEDLDILWYTAGAFVNYWAREGLIRNVDDLYEKYNWVDRKAAIIQNYEVPGLGYYHVPDAGVLTPLVYYNQGILDEAGVELPTTIEGFFDIAPAIKAAGYTPYANGFGAGRMFRLQNWLIRRGLGSEEYEKLLFWGEDPDKSIESAEIFRSQAVIDSYATQKRFMDEGLYPDGVLGMDNTEALRMFVAGEAAFYQNGNWMVNSIRAAAEEAGTELDFGIMNLPPFNEGDTGDLKYLANFANGTLIPSYVSDEKVAVIGDLMNETIKKEYARETFLTEGILSANNDFTSEELVELVDPVSADLIVSLGEKSATLIIDHWQEAAFKTRYQEIIDLVLIDELTPEEAAQELYEAAIATLE